MIDKIKHIFIVKNWWNVLIWFTGHCNRAAVSRSRYGVEKTVDTHKILINAIKIIFIVKRKRYCLTLSVPGEKYSRNVSCAINYVSTFLLYNEHLTK
jgi:hypothetical protein